MRGDTIVYNADAFNLADGSMLDALISRLPGTTLTRDGQIFVRGKKVESLLVNGRDFFAGNPEVALQNLPAYIVNKVKVYNRSGWASRVTGSDKGDKEIVMDVTLKREYAKNYIGNLEGGMGTAHRWIGRGLALKFSDKEQMVGFFNLNNLNNTDRGSIGGKWSSDDVASGLVATKTAGISYQNYLHGQLSQLQGDLCYTHTGIDNEERNATQTFLPTGDAWLKSVSRGTHRSDLLKGNIRLNLGVKNLSIRNQADFSYTNRKGWGSDMSQTNDSSSVLNRMLLSNSDEAHNFNLNLSTNYTYYILKMDMLRWGLNMSYNNLSQNQYSLYDVTFLRSDSPRDYRNNYLTSPNHDLKIGANLGYDYALHADTLSLVYQYQYAYNQARNRLYRLGLSAYVSLPWHFQLSTDMTMRARRGYQQREMNTTDWVWNAQLTRSFAKGHLVAKLQGADILRQLSATSYAVNAQGRTETWHNSIPRYAMLSLAWRFNVSPRQQHPQK